MMITTLLTLGLGWIVNAAAGGIVEGEADDRFRQVQRELRDRLPGLLGRPEGWDLVRGMRRAQIRALDRLIRDFQEVGPHPPLTKLSAADPFFERALGFCTESLRSAPAYMPQPTLESTGDATWAASIALVPESNTVESGREQLANAVLAELSAALNGVPMPAAFERHFRDGGRGRGRYVALFGLYVAEEIKENWAFCDVLNAQLQFRTLTAIIGVGKLTERIAHEFGPALTRIESGVDAVSRSVDDLRRLMLAEKGVPIPTVQRVLERFGELDVPAERVEERLQAWAVEFLDLRDKWSQVTESTPDVAAVKAEALALMDAGDFAGARRLLSAARETLRAARQDRARQEAALLAAEAKVDRLEFRYRDAAERYAEAGALVGAFDASSAIEYRWEQTSTLQQLGTEFGDNTALLNAIAGWEKLLEASSRNTVPDRWGATLNNLGNTLGILGERESGTARLEEAVAVYRAALEEWARGQVPLKWAVTQNNLGNALKTLGERESGTARLEEAVAAFRAALEERTYDRVPLDWAMTQNNLGIALTALGERENGTARLEEAVAAFRATLKALKRERVPLDWAATQSNLGVALSTLGKRESGTARLEEAVAAYRAALEEQIRERVPLDWAMTQNNLGNALLILGERESGTARLEQAVAAYQAALEEQTRERVPLRWAMTQNNLGTALSTLGEREIGTARLEEAVAAYRAALEERMRERVPLDWAMTQNNLGNTLSTLGERESGTARLEEAVEAFGTALKEWTRERMPLDWATTQNNLGAALTTLGERESGTARLEEAVAAYQAALEERTRERAPFDWAATQNNLGHALRSLGEREGGTARLQEAVAAFEAALEVFGAAGADYYTSMAQRNLEITQVLLKERQSL